MPDWGIQTRIVDTVKTKKIQDFIDKARVSILVGFPSGRQHAQMFHKDKDGNYVGYNGEAPTDVEPMDTDELAKMLSFGTNHSPARPFLEDGIESQKDRIYSELEAQIKKAKENQNPNWDKVGTMGVGAVQEFVRSDYYKETLPNSQKTIDYKGSDKPLIDGGDLVGAVTFIVR